MEFLEFEGMTGILNKNHENGFRPLPFHHDPQTGDWIICCAPSPEEIADLQHRGHFWFKITCGKNFYPVLPIMGDVRFYQVYDGCEIPYEYEQDKHHREVIFPWVQGPIKDLPQQVIIDGKTFTRTAKYDIQHKPNRALDVDDLFFRMPTLEEAHMRAEQLIEKARGLKSLYDNMKENIYQDIRKNSAILPVLVRKGQAGKETILC